MKKFGYISALSFATPFLASAATIGSLDDIFTYAKSILNTVLPIIIALAVVYFVWGMFQVITASDEEKKDKAKSTVIYGIISIFVMVSIWGLVNILSGTLGLTNTNKGNNVNDQIPTGAK
jgi:UDP-N-acetylmuramyl pentapeptide phosphotransferase/UDP-N-acetylglucosamine-1-phosphate transferase